MERQSVDALPSLPTLILTSFDQILMNSILEWNILLYYNTHVHSFCWKIEYLQNFKQFIEWLNFQYADVPWWILCLLGNYKHDDVIRISSRSNLS